MRPALERVSAAARTPAVRYGLVAGLVTGCLLALLHGRWILGPHLAFEGVAFACFVALLVLEAVEPWLSAKVVAATGGVLIVMALTFPPTESADVWSYVMYGRVAAVHGADPYTTPPAAFPDDRWVRLVRPIWRDSPSLYGPLFQSAAATVVRSAHGSALRARLGFQLIAALALTGILGLLWRRTHDPSVLAALALNPLVVIGVVNGAHADALVGLTVLGGVLLAERGRDWGAGFVLGLGGLVKVVTLLPAGVVALWSWRRRGLRPALVNGAMTGITVVAGYLVVGGTTALRPLESTAGLTNRFSVWRLAWWLHPTVQADGERHLAGGAVSWASMGVLLGLALLAALPSLRRAGPDRAVALALAVFLLGGLYVQPWYVMWVLPLMALAWRSPLAWLAFGHQAALTLAYALALRKDFSPVGSDFRTAYFVALAVAEAVAIAVLVGVALGELRRSRRSGPGVEEPAVEVP